jgi:hypothetical protein
MKSKKGFLVKEVITWIVYFLLIGGAIYLLYQAFKQII